MTNGGFSDGDRAVVMAVGAAVMAVGAAVMAVAAVVMMAVAAVVMAVVSVVVAIGGFDGGWFRKKQIFFLPKP